MNAADRWTWIDVVRRTRLPRITKGIAFLLATYADNDGSRVFPGLATIAVAAGVNYKSAKTAVKQLVDAGLLERVSSLRRRGSASEYRLILAEDLMERAEVLTPAQFDTAVEAVRAGQRKPGTGRQAPRTSNSVRAAQRPEPDPEPEPSTDRSTPLTESSTDRSTPQYGPFGTAVHNHYMDTTTTSHLDEDPRTAVTVTRENQAVTKPILRLVVDEDRPKPTKGNGFCLACYASGKVTVAADPVSGSACVLHLREVS